MEMYEACEAFSSLSQETRLKVFKLLLEYGRDGVPAGKVAEELQMPANTLSFHLSHMSKAGLVTSKKAGRTVTYFASTDLIGELISFLKDNCCVREGNKPKGKGRKC
ncbi:ArsR family transcriptional regulator [bacterium]|nr:MAG: ArsR family transcriptional regulator [bacterium]